jgi:hypothetical protein
MANTQEESSSDLEMETSPKCIDYPAENTRAEEEAPNMNTVAILQSNTYE